MDIENLIEIVYYSLVNMSIARSQYLFRINVMCLHK